MVESVVADEGFWVGDGPGMRVFVRLTPEARNSSGESPFQVEAGQTIELEGTVTGRPVTRWISGSSMPRAQRS